MYHAMILTLVLFMIQPFSATGIFRFHCFIFVKVSHESYFSDRYGTWNVSKLCLITMVNQEITNSSR